MLHSMLHDKPREPVKKQIHHFADKGLYSDSMIVFPVIMFRCKSCTLKKAECQRVDVFEFWCWRRLFRVPWTTRRSNESILKGINLNIHWKDWCWSSNTLATWCEEPTHGKDPDAGKYWGQKEKWMTEDEMVGWHHEPNGRDWANSRRWGGQGSLACCSSWGRKQSDMTWQWNNNNKNILYCKMTLFISIQSVVRSAFQIWRSNLQQGIRRRF